MNRREFFGSFAPSPPRSFQLTRFARRAMGTTFEILLPTLEPSSRVPRVVAEAFDAIDHVEQRFSVFRTDSEVSHINRQAFHGPCQLSTDLYFALHFAGRLHRDTRGAFDVASGSLSEAWGFRRRRARIPSTIDCQAALDASGMRHVRLDHANRTIRLTHPDVSLNFGAAGKGLGLDRAAEVLQRHGIFSALLHSGLSTVLALGAPPNDPRGWAVSVRHPREPRTLSCFALRDQALATSAATHQYIAGHVHLGHVLDPRTGCPAQQMLSSTAFAPSALEADALSTAFFVLGVEATGRYCAIHKAGAFLLENGEQCATFGRQEEMV